MKKNSDKNKNSGKCLIIGAGAIGKAVGGCAFARAGFDVMFADVSQAVISDINARGGYDLIVSETGKKQFRDEVRGVRAALSGSEEVTEFATQADFICTSLGERGLDAVLPFIAETTANSERELHILLLENIHGCDRKVASYIENYCGYMPDNVSVDYACVERMSRPVINGSCCDVICEQFFPVILPSVHLAGTVLSQHPEAFMLTDDISVYYARKLLLGNLGHAVLGYMGIPKGYVTVADAMADSEITDMLAQAFDESVFALECLYGRRNDEFACYAKSRLTRLENSYFEDTLKRVVRSPLRKLGREERMVKPAVICAGEGRLPSALCRVMAYAVHYFDADDPECITMRRLYESGGVTAVLEYAAEDIPESIVRCAEEYDKIICENKSL